MSLDLGERQGQGIDPRTEGYEKMYGKDIVNDMGYGTKVKGEVYISGIKQNDEDKPFFSVVLNDHDDEITYIFGFFNPSLYDMDGEPTNKGGEGVVLYGRKGSKVYALLDPMFHFLKGETLDEKKNRSVEFETFRKTINDNVKTVTMEATESTNAMAKDAMSPLMIVRDVELLTDLGE